MFSSSAPALPARRRPCISPAAARRVLLADRARFPRDKPCGGGLTGRALKQAPCDVTPVVERVVDTFELRLHYKRSFRRTLERAADPDDAAATARRVPGRAGSAAGRDLQRRHARRRRSRSAPRGSLRGWGRRTSPPTRSSAPTERTASSRRPSGRGRHRARRRARGQRRLGASRPRALRLDRRRRARPARRRLWLAVPQGRPRESRRRRLGPRRAAPARPPRTALRAYGVDPDVLTDVRGHRLPMRRVGATTPARDNVVLVGDAAGLVDPLSGDGMYEAFTSARLAADAIVAGDLTATRRPWRGGSTTTQAPRGRPSARSTATLRCASGPLARRACSASSAGSAR